MGLIPLLVISAILAQTLQSSPTGTAAGTAPATPVQTAQNGPIAIVSTDIGNLAKAATVTGAVEVTSGAAIIAAGGSITSAGQTTRVILPHRGELLVCASTTINLAADTSADTSRRPGLLMAMDHGAIEMSYAAGAATAHNADILQTPDFRILFGGPGSSDVKVRLGRQGDTCVDNSGENAPYVLVSSVFEGGVYRVQPGQRVMFQHGSLHEVVDQEKESCGCPPGAPQGNEFPLAQSEGLAPMPNPEPAVDQDASNTLPTKPLMYKGADHVPQPAAASAGPAESTAANSPVPNPAVHKKPGFFAKVGHFFRRIFGAEKS
jgi:hypothetical protein